MPRSILRILRWIFNPVLWTVRSKGLSVDPIVFFVFLLKFWSILFFSGCWIGHICEAGAFSVTHVSEKKRKLHIGRTLNASTSALNTRVKKSSPNSQNWLRHPQSDLKTFLRLAQLQNVMCSVPGIRDSLHLTYFIYQYELLNYTAAVQGFRRVYPSRILSYLNQ